jgi:hypothetical protein
MLRIKLATVVALAVILSFPAQLRAENSCTNIKGHIAGQIIGPDPACGGGTTEIGTFTGNPSGTFVACITSVQERGNGELIFELAHTYTTTTGDTFQTTDRVVAHPLNPPEYRIQNRAEITGGTGIYEDAFGSSHDHGTVDLGTGVVSVDYKGRICTP